MKSKSLKQKEVITDRQKANIFKKTGGIIGTHEFYEVKGVTENFRSMIKPKYKKDILYHMILEDSFMHPKTKEYIGDFKRAQWYSKNNMVITEKHPHGCAVVLKKGIPYSGVINDSDIEGYCGYSQRGAQTFRIGDKIFDAKWRGKHSQEELDCMCFAQRGGKTIKTWAQAEQAAINLSHYLG